MKQITVGVLAHVDAGKTTLCEAMLYSAGAIRKLGRVDNRDSWFDTHAIERSRGITIFSKQAPFTLNDVRFTLLDTPGHVDFASETERVLPVLDCAILVVSGTDGVQSHTETIWRLLRRYRVPTFIFITKMDSLSLDKGELLRQLRSRLSTGCIDCSDAVGGNELPETLCEAAAECDDALLERYLDGEMPTFKDIAALVGAQRIFPCFFGSGLKLTGVEALLKGLVNFNGTPVYHESFAAIVYKIDHDAKGARLTHLKVTGGSLRVRDEIFYVDSNGGEHREKAAQLRIYSGARYDTADEITAGGICAVAGLASTYAGQSLGCEQHISAPVLEPVLICRLELPPDCDARTLLPQLAILEEEDPQLRFRWDEKLNEITLHAMGDIQTEILQSEIASRFGVNVGISQGRVLYKETIKAPVEGVGHFEPLRHYAEVHLVLEPLPRGSGIVCSADCREEILAGNWQRLVLYNLEEKEHVGVLGGFPLTDVHITLRSGRSHLKHTEGGDMREAALRAVRMGLMNAECELLEPYYRYKLRLPATLVGRAVGDIRTMGGSFDVTQNDDGSAEVFGRAPVAKLRGYASEVAAYTSGRGVLVCISDGYDTCLDAERVLAERGYDPERDVENPADSVFCRRGAGFIVKWNEVPHYMHLESCLTTDRDEQRSQRHRRINIDESELEALMQREFGEIKRAQYSAPREYRAERDETESPKKQRLLIDGYNVIFAWDDLAEIARDNMDLARRHLMDELANYRGFTGTEIVLVFDAYRSGDNSGKKFEYHGIEVLFTEEGVTADAWLERFATEIGKSETVRLVSSDNLVQVGALHAGVLRMSSRELEREVARVNARISELLHGKRLPEGARFEDMLDEEAKKEWEQMKSF